MYKLVISDLDETLLNDHHQVCSANIEMINKIKDIGIKFVPATGRGFREVQHVLKALNLYNKKDEYVISYNGCSLTENKDDRLIQFDALPFEKAKKLFTFGQTKNVCIHIYTKDMLYSYNTNPEMKKRFNLANTEYKEIGSHNIDFLKNIPIAKMLYHNEDISYLKSFRSEMDEIINNQINQTYSSSCYMELNKIKVDKGTTVLRLAKKLGIKQSEIIVVGDNYNDISMLKIAGLSVAVNNAVDDVKDICDYVCDNNNNDGVIAEIVEKFIL